MEDENKILPESLTLTGEDGDMHELYVLEETEVNERHYFLLSEEAEGDSDAYIFREEQGTDAGDEVTIVPVTDENEFDAVEKIFAELMDDTDFQ